ncbi:unnamed protein product, partial [Mesorhabditis spiculigera]
MSTIFALSSGALPSAIAIMRMSGPRSKEVLSTLSRKKILQPRQLFYARLYDHDNGLMDSAMAAYLPGPSTFTGEDTTELYLHGSKAVVDTVAKCLLKFDGLRHAKRGEFTKRAFYNGKLDLTAARGLHNLINSETDRQRRHAQRQMEGDRDLQQIRDELLEAFGRATLMIDFGEHVDTSLEDSSDTTINESNEMLPLCQTSLVQPGTQLRLKEADIVVAVSDAREDDIVLDELLSDLQEVVNGAPIISVKNKADLASNKVPANNQSLSASVLSCALTTKGVEELWANLQRVVDDICPEESGPALTQVELLMEAHDAVLQANSVSDVALCAHHLQIALDCIGELTCSTVNEAILDRLFAQFCIGK